MSLGAAQDSGHPSWKEALLPSTRTGSRLHMLVLQRLGSEAPASRADGLITVFALNQGSHGCDRRALRGDSSP